MKLKYKELRYLYSRLTLDAGVHYHTNQWLLGNKVSWATSKHTIYSFFGESGLNQAGWPDGTAHWKENDKQKPKNFICVFLYLFQTWNIKKEKTIFCLFLFERNSGLLLLLRFFLKSHAKFNIVGHHNWDLLSSF